MKSMGRLASLINGGMSRQETLGFLRLALTSAMLTLLVWSLFLLDSEKTGTVWNPINRIASNLFYAYIAFAYWTLRKARVPADERDRAISAESMRSGFWALALVVGVSGAIFNTPPYDEIFRAQSTDWVQALHECYIVFGCWIESSVCVFMYWRDRR